MTFLLILSLLTLVAAHNNKFEKTNRNKIVGDVKFSGLTLSNSKNDGQLLFRQQHQQLSRKPRDTKILKVLNGTELVMECAPAEYLVRTHMAPDFENPQLVRKLDWFHEGSLIASFQQDVVTGISEEWWVASTRYELRRPFYQLRVSPILAEDSGEYKCFLETDPLFTFDQPSAVVNLLVMVKPFRPSRPLVSDASNNYTFISDRSAETRPNVEHRESIVFISWNHSIGSAHRPILRYSILISQTNDSMNIRVLTTKNNQTSKVIDGLLPNTQYTFSVRAENAAGDSDFGVGTIFKTAAPVPKTSPKVMFVRNQSGDNDKSTCVEVGWSFDLPNNGKQQLQNFVGYRIKVTELIITHKSHRSREWSIKKNTQKSALLCSLEFNAEFQLSIEANTGNGFSPPGLATFRTSESAPAGPPEHISIRLVLPNIIAINWREPKNPNGKILSYQIYVRKKPQYHSQSHQESNDQIDLSSISSPTLIRLLVETDEKSKSFAYNITNLAPSTTYELRLSASTRNGESNKSQAWFVQTDQIAPHMPKIEKISYECLTANRGENSVRIEWSDSTKFLNLIEAPVEVNSSVKSVKKKDDAKFFYQIQFEDSRRKFVLNSTINSITIDNLETKEQYNVRVLAAIQSRFDKMTYFYSQFSKPELFKIDKSKCQFHSSICSTENKNCKQIISLSNQVQNSDVIFFPLLFLAISSTVLLSATFTCFLKRNCAFFKTFVKDKKLDRETYQHETVSLVQETLTDISEMQYGRTIRLQDFDEYCIEMQANNNNGFRCQFQELEEDTLMTQTTVVSPPLLEVSLNSEKDLLEMRSAQNGGGNFVSKNRYVNVCALEHSRIQIRQSSDVSKSDQPSNLNNASSNRVVAANTATTYSTGSVISTEDDGYINANYVDSCDEKNAYIATQAPLPHTFTDFWAMVWQENCSLIVMITNFVENGRRKCDQYWPSSINTPTNYGRREGNAIGSKFEVTMNMQHTNSVFTHRIFTICHKPLQAAASAESSLNSSITGTLPKNQQHSAQQLVERRIVHHLQFTSWPDHGVPQMILPLLHFINYAADCYNTFTKNNNKCPRSGPIIVHCSAGVGRSGSFILLDSMRRHLLKYDQINIQFHLRQIRRQRSRSVQTLEQYIFCHNVLRQLIRHGKTRQSITDFHNYLHFLFNQHIEKSGPRNSFQLLKAKSKIQLQFEDFCKCPHEPNCLYNSKKRKQCIMLPGYHCVDEFMIGRWSAECAEMWSILWRQQCQLIVLMGADAEVNDFFSTTTMANQTPWPLFVSEFDHDSATLLRRQTWNKNNKLTTSLNCKIENNQNLFDSGCSEWNADDDSLYSNGVKIDSTSPMSQVMESSRHFFTPNDNRMPSTSVITTTLLHTENHSNDSQIIQLKSGDTTMDIHIIRTRSSALELDVWLEIERIQDYLLQSKTVMNRLFTQQQPMMILDPRSTKGSIPFALCALQSTACQLETEGFVDVPLYLDMYRRIACGCWSSQSNIEYIYAKILELLQLKQSAAV